MTEGALLPGPGWYVDPVAGAPYLRWWDGRGWTAAVSHPPPGPPGPAWSATPARVIPTRAFWWALLGLLLGEVAGAVLGGVGYLLTGSSTGSVSTLFGEVGLWAGMLGSCLFVSRRYGTRSLRRDFTLGFKRRDVAFGVAAVLSALVVEAILSGAFAHSRFKGTNTQLLTSQKGDGAGFVLVTLIAALGAPFFEELFFRGLIRTALSARLGPVGAVLGQGVFFGLCHYEPTNGLGNVEVMVIVGSLGIILGFVALWSKRLGGGMVGHCLFNLVAAIAILTT